LTVSLAQRCPISRPTQPPTLRGTEMSTGQSAVIVTPIVVLAVALLQATLKIID